MVAYPGDDLYIIWGIFAEGQDVGHALWKVYFAHAVPVLRAIDVLELEC